MSYKFIISEKFKLDISKSRKWYNEKQKGLGKKFYNEVKISLQAIRKTPQFGIRYDQIRCLPLKKYPFMIHYEVDDSTSSIYIYACIHCSLNPDSHWITNKGEDQ
jgi:hypothetical protein